MFSILNYKGNVNLNNIEIPFHLRQIESLRNQPNTNAGGNGRRDETYTMFMRM
jgi:hypothetical protein